MSTHSTPPSARVVSPSPSRGDYWFEELIASENNVLPGRSWQSMKERWKKFIRPQIMERYNKLREQGLARPVEEAVDDALCGDSGSDTTSESESDESDDDDEPEQIPAVGASEDENNVEDEEGGGDMAEAEPSQQNAAAAATAESPSKLLTEVLMKPDGAHVLQMLTPNLVTFDGKAVSDGCLFYIAV
ncbi:hypothetical protein Pmar_PMAR009085 [Perkinsus marinus ATCC 50983]|uniref:Rap1 Myb domain-containing protein n=1 Tax=Perkinsus marinus (strain ATCC 50983 / TXsc) TaxID=423536 RepID=C5LQ57_PERM5|nr:hypothetical protein Pmar_PMAR009085 [Perkinsus marinus ATCC 50983]EER01165.1 hypothetical protein Pmar_PMAR009085 [Perkinsus marinus ATCC 50983]|eukprot:XP_002768447.1 hypothetical protein Pmar_PMAR009085 [Perkinsus marinus ATCC 50983]